MTWAPIVQLVRLGALLTLANFALAQEFTVDRLQRLLQDAPRVDVRFTELRESRWLAAPIESSGTMRSNATMLEKQVERPRRETWRILGDRMQVSAPGPGGVKEILLAESPVAAALAGALRHVMEGNLTALNDDFRLALSGDERNWSLKLTPRDQDVARQLDHISLQGAAGRMAVIAILESRGDRTTTRLHYPE